MRRVALLLTAAIVAVAVATAAFAQSQQKNTYSVKGAVAPTGKASKAKPLPVSVTFAYSVGEEHGLQPAAVKRYTIGFAGVRVNGQYFNTCQAGAITAAGNDDSSCPKSSLVGKGTIDNYVYSDSDPSGKSAGFSCKKSLKIYNSGKSKATLFISGDPAQCGGVGALAPIPAKYVKFSGGGTALQFEVPPSVLHPVPGLTVAVRSTQSKISLMRKKVKGVRHGYYESTGGCSGGKRQIAVTFLTESGQTDTAKTTSRC